MSGDVTRFAVNAERWLRADMTVLEVGPGDHTWMLRIAPLVRTFIVAAPAAETLQRTRERCAALGIHNVECVLIGGDDLGSLPDRCVDLFFSADATAQSAFEHTSPGASEIVRVLKPGAICVSRFDLGTQAKPSGVGEAGNRYRDRADTLGRPCHASAEMLNRLYERAGLRVFAVQQEGSCCTVLATRTDDSVAIPKGME